MSSPSPTVRRRSLYLVTDRRRLGEAMGRPSCDWRSLLLQQIEGAIAGGIDYVQIRERDVEPGELTSIVRDAVRLARGSETRVIVNDRADVAIAAGASGVHLRESSARVRDLRRLAHPLIVGRSIHSPVPLDAQADYLIAGAVFPTVSKPRDAATVGVGGLAAIVRAFAPTPVFAIGGVAEGNLDAIVRTGAAGVAAIRAFIPSHAPEGVSPEVRKIVRNLRFAFDSA